MLFRSARDKEGFDRAINKRLHDLEVAHRDDRKQAIHSHHEIDKKLVDLAKSIQKKFRQVGANMSGIVEEMRGQGRRRDERLDWLERHA